MKKLNKPICILLCILLICLSFVPVFADTYSTITPETFVSLFQSISNQPLTLITDDTYNLIPAAIRETIEPYDYDVFSYTWVNSYPNNIWFSYSPIPDGFYNLSQVQLFSAYTLSMTDAPDVMRRDLATYNASTGVISSGNPVSGHPCMILYTTQQSASNNYIYFKNNVQFSLGGYNYLVSVTHQDPLDPSNPNYPSGNPYNPTVPTDWNNYTEMIAGLLYDNFKFTCNNTVYNSTWMPVGEYLMYDFLCKNNPQNDTVSFNNWEYQNYVYRICGLNHEDDVITIMELLDDINYYHGNYLASISNNLNYDPEYDLGFAYNVVTPLNKIAKVYASDQEIEAREAAAENQQVVVDNFLDSQGDGSVSASNLGELADSSAEIKSNFNTGYSASGVWDVFDRNWDWFSNTTKNNLEPPAQNVRSVEDYETPFLDNAINEILRLKGN